MVVEGRQMRMDLVLHFVTGRVWVDVSIVNPQVKSYVGKKGRDRREKDKEAKWSKLSKDNGCRFVPFVMDTFGALGEQAIGLLSLIAKEAYDTRTHRIFDNPKVWMGKYRRAIVERLSVALAHANSAMIDEACLKSKLPGASTQALYKGLRRLWW